MVIFRPHRGGLKEAMAESKEFNTVEDMLQYICDEHNYSVPWFQIKPSDIFIKYEGSDERVKWHNIFYLMFERRSKISDLDGLCKYFGIQDNPNLPDDDRDTYFLEDEPIGVIGMFSTDYEKVDL